MSRPRILMADDHRMVAEGLRSLLEPTFELVEIVEDGRQLVDAAKRLAPDVIVADITMPELNGLDAVKQLRQAGCKARVVFLDHAQRPQLRGPGHVRRRFGFRAETLGKLRIVDSHS